MIMSEQFYFNYGKYIQGSLTIQQIDVLLGRLIEFKIPNIPLPYVGAYLELTMLGLQIAGIIKLAVMKKNRIDIELMVSKQLHDQDIRRRHDDDVIGEKSLD